jgi:hypothetical protein
MTFHDSLARYYIKWFQDCHNSAIYCMERGNTGGAREYLKDASKYLTIIMENWDVISTEHQMYLDEKRQ